MKFIVKKVKIYSNEELNIYIPLKVPNKLTAIDPIVQDIAILGNSVAYEFLKNMFSLAMSLDLNEIIYIPTKQLKINEYREIWKYGIFDLDIVLVNYHGTQLKAKEIFKAITNNNYSHSFKEISLHNYEKNYPERWLIDRKLTTKRFKDTLIISTNRDVFLKFIHDTDWFIGMEDDEEYNFDYHYHEDLIGTSKDNGFNFLYYHKKDNSLAIEFNRKRSR